MLQRCPEIHMFSSVASTQRHSSCRQSDAGLCMVVLLFAMTLGLMTFDIFCDRYRNQTVDRLMLQRKRTGLVRCSRHAAGLLVLQSPRFCKPLAAISLTAARLIPTGFIKTTTAGRRTLRPISKNQWTGMVRQACQSGSLSNLHYVPEEMTR